MSPTDDTASLGSDHISLHTTNLISIKVISATGFPFTSKFWKREGPSACVRVSIDGGLKKSESSFTTSIVKSSSPFWNDSFLFNLGTETNVSPSVHFELYDDFVYKKSLGDTKRTVEELLLEQRNNDELELPLNHGASLKIYVQHKTDGDAAELALQEINNQIPSEQSLSLPVSASGLTVSQGLAELVRSLAKLIDIVDIFAEIHPYVHIAWKFVSSVFRVIEAQLDRDAKILTLVNTMTTLYSFIHPLETFRNENLAFLSALENVISAILKQTVECVLFIQTYFRDGFTVNAICSPFTTLDDAIQKFCEAFGSLANSLDSSLMVQTTVVSLRIDTRVEELTLRGRLNPVETQLARHEPCHPKTRLHMIESITDWAFNTSNAKSNVFWLHGVAGSGKSALACTIANYFHQQRRLGAFIGFDRRGNQEHNDPLRVIPTLAFSLGQFDRNIWKHVMNASDPKTNAQMMDLGNQFDKLVTEPLRLSAAALQAPIVIVIDALDECGSDQSNTRYDRGPFLAEFAEAMAKLPPGIRIIITSRAQHDIKTILTPINAIHIEELEVSLESDDIAIFIRQQMSKLSGVPKGWPDESSISKLVRRSEGLFIWAATACQLMKYKPKQTFEKLVTGDTKCPLDVLYNDALQTSCGPMWDNPSFPADYTAIVGVILVAKNPLSPKAIDLLLDTEESYRLILLLGSVIHYESEEKPVHILHISFQEHLSNKSKCDSRWYIDIDLHNDNLAKRCIELLGTKLATIFQHLMLDQPFTTEVLDEAVTYACFYWIPHTCEMKACPEGFDIQLLKWLHRDVLHWLEAMSVLGRSRTASSLLEELLAWIKIKSPKSIDLHDFVYDASRFAAFFSDTIAEHPALVYLTALPFAPLSSKIYETFHQESFPTVMGGYQQWWSSSLRVLKSLDRSIHSLAFSPDGSTIVSTGNSMSEYSWADPPGLRIWDIMAGTELVPFRETDGRSYVTYSPDGSEIWLASEEGTVLTLDSATGAELSKLSWERWGTSAPVPSKSASTFPAVAKEDGSVTPDLHTNWNKLPSQSTSKVTITAKEDISSAPAPRAMDDMLYSAPKDKLTMLADDHKQAATPLKHPESFIRAAFSSNGSSVVFGTEDGSIYVVDRRRCLQMYSLKSLAPLEPRGGLYRMFRSIDFSPDNSEFAVGSGDGTIHIRKTIGGKEISVLKGHSKEVTALKYTEDALISSAKDGTIRTWKTATSKEVRKVETQIVGGFQPLAFSSDGVKVASTSDDGTIHIWDTMSGQELGPILQDHFNPVSSIAFSCGNATPRLVSGAFLNPIHIWDISSQNAAKGHSKVQRHIRPPQHIAFAEDGFRVRSWRVVEAWSDTVDDAQFWETLTGKKFKMEPEARSADFASEGFNAVNLSSGETIRLLDPDTGNEWQMPDDSTVTFPMALNQSGSLSCSEDGIVTSESDDSEKEVWRLPLELKHRCYDTHNNYIAFGMWNCRVLVVRLPCI